MKIQCTSCKSILNLDENKYNKENLLIRCPQCSYEFRITLSKKTQVTPTIHEEKHIAVKETREIKPSRKIQPIISEKISTVIIWILFCAFLMCILYMAHDFIL